MAATTAAHRGTAACIRAFGQIQQDLNASKSDLRAQIPSSALEDEFGRLRIWTANIEALQKGHSSLDYWLREAPLVHENVLKLLEDLYSILTESACNASLFPVYIA